MQRRESECQPAASDYCRLRFDFLTFLHSVLLGVFRAAAAAGGHRVKCLAVCCRVR